MIKSKRKLNKHELLFLISKFIFVFFAVAIFIFSFETIWIFALGFSEIGDFIVLIHFIVPTFVVYGTVEIMRSKQECYSEEILKTETKNNIKKTISMISILFIVLPLIVDLIFHDELIAYMNSKG